MKKPKILLGGFAVGAMMALIPLTGMATIIGSPHDFSPSGSGSDSKQGIATYTWYGSTNTYNNPCQVCHTPHKAALYSQANGPLWNHAVGVGATAPGYYITYDQAGSATFNALNLGTLTLGSSVACLSCHDGSIAVNQPYSSTPLNGVYGSSKLSGQSTTNVYAPIIVLDTTTGQYDGKQAAGAGSLTTMHPIGVPYQTALEDGAELNPVATLPTYMLQGVNGTVECASCHDIHQTEGIASSGDDDLVVSLNNAQLCLTCHNK
jgi:hypothetical protein